MKKPTVTISRGKKLETDEEATHGKYGEHGFRGLDDDLVLGVEDDS